MGARVHLHYVLISVVVRFPYVHDFPTTFILLITIFEENLIFLLPISFTNKQAFSWMNESIICGFDAEGMLLMCSIAISG